MPTRPSTSLAIFLTVAFGVSWALALVLFLIGKDVAAPVRLGILSLFMFGPALGAVVAQRVAGARVRPLIGVIPGKAPERSPNRWWLVAWLAPMAFAFVTLGVGAMMPGVSLGFDVDTIVARFTDSVPADQVAQARVQLSAIPLPAMIALMIVQALIAGISINAVAAFGEELGWRGFLYARFHDDAQDAPSSSHFWRGAVVVGALWGVWHAPIILQGHNYPVHSLAGVPMMTLFCILLAPWLAYVRMRTRSVLAASILHGSFNASAGFAFLFLRGGNDLLVGATGLAGLLVLAAADLGLWAHMRSRAGVPPP